MENESLKMAFCTLCKQFSVWENGVMVSPNNASVMPPNSDLREDIQEDYNEARSVLSRSPRGAAALLRLCVQKLCQQLELPGKDLDRDIGTLVSIGLSARIQKALDIVRVIGNNAVHPGVLDVEDDIETASKLFELVNHIAYSMITQPKEIETLYVTKVPQPQKEHIEERDSVARNKTKKQDK